ncbi:ImmA/IrrE family metallo-endopeptidase [Microbacterium sp. NPDC055502]
MRDSRRREIKVAANRLLAEVGFGFDGPVDVFHIVRQLGIWLIFQPLENALGATLRVGAGGIIVTTQRSPKIQRFTAAHELAHWCLHRGDLEWDTPDAVLSSIGASEREREAQLFASHLLMPRQLVRRAIHTVDVQDPAQMTGVQLYGVSRELQVSYEAAARQLQNLGILRGPHVSSLLKYRPLALKTLLNDGVAPGNAHADVWQAPATGRDFTTLPDDEIIIRLPENALAGYRWRAELPSDVAEVVRNQPSAPDPAAIEAPRLVGGVGERTVVVRTNDPGAWRLDLELTRSFSDADPIDKIAFEGWVDQFPAIANSAQVVQQLRQAAVS